MEQEFIPYKEAIALKDLGFNEPCMAYFVNKHPFEKALFRIRGNGDWVTVGNDSYEKGSSFAAAPLYQQAFDWFYEKHGYHSYFVEVLPNRFRFHIEKWEDHRFTSDRFEGKERTNIERLKKLIETVKRKRDEQ